MNAARRTVSSLGRALRSNSYFPNKTYYPSSHTRERHQPFINVIMRLNSTNVPADKTDTRNGGKTPREKLLKKLGVVENPSMIRMDDPTFGTVLQKRRVSGSRRRRGMNRIVNDSVLNPRSMGQTGRGGNSVRVQSFYAAQMVDIAKVLTKIFGNASMRHMRGQKSVIVELKSPSTEGIEGETPKYVAVFRFGSVVFFNIGPRLAEEILRKIKAECEESITNGFERKEYFEVHVQPDLQENEPVVSYDFVTVQSLNLNSVAVISDIMAQTVALDSYNDTVDALLATFASINSSVKRTGTFTNLDKETLFKVVAQNNSIFIDMLSKLKLKDRSNTTAWNMSQYGRVHEGLKAEFEIDDRFQDIEFKLNLIQQNAKFFLEILHNQKSNTLEWIIIILIGFECGLMCLDMSGMGTMLFSYEWFPK